VSQVQNVSQAVFTKVDLEFLAISNLKFGCLQLEWT